MEGDHKIPDLKHRQSRLDQRSAEKLWEKWLDESYALSVAHGAGRKPAAKKARKNKAIRTKPKRKAVKKT